MRKRLFTIIATMLLVLCAAPILSDEIMPAVSAAETQSPEVTMAVSVYNALNAERANAGLAPLAWDADLVAAANVRAVECSASFSHTRPDGTAWYTVNSAIMMGENLAYGYNDTYSVMRGWMNSPTHKANILDASFTRVGISIYKANGKLYFAQEFGRS